MVVYLFLILQPALAQQQQQPNIVTLCEKLSFSKLNIVPDANDVQLLGRITNNSTQALDSVTIISEFYDNNDRLIDVRDTFPSLSNLGPGDSSPFKIVTSGQIPFIPNTSRKITRPVSVCTS